MRLKQRGGDFRVEEVAAPPFDPRGAHYVHRLVKRGITTPEALRRIAAALGLDPGVIAIAGLKDRQAVATQFVSLPGLRADLSGEGFQLRFLGRASSPVSSGRMLGNRFDLLVRDLSAEDVDRLRRHLPAVTREGLPNYFDDQRFGVLRYGQGFLARQIALGDAEGAVRSYLCLSRPGLPTRDRAARDLIRRRWGDWRGLSRRVRFTAFRPVLEHLHRRPEDYEGALLTLPPRLLGFHFNAYQSFLWNASVDRLLSREVPGGWRLPSLMGPLYAPPALGERGKDLLGLGFPLPEPGCRREDPRVLGALAEVLRREGITLESLRPRPGSGFRFLSGERPVFVVPADLRAGSPARDDLNPGRLMVRLRLFLPRGAYATLAVKRLFAGGGEAARPPGRDRGRPGAASPGPPRPPVTS